MIRMSTGQRPQESPRAVCIPLISASIAGEAGSSSSNLVISPSSDENSPCPDFPAFLKA